MSRMTLIDVVDDYVRDIGHSISIIMKQLMSVDGIWEYDDFRQQAFDLIRAYEMRIGCHLINEQIDEIIQNMAYHPYKFMSSDKKQIVAWVKNLWSLGLKL